jgi:hypothetical protein
MKPKSNPLIQYCSEDDQILELLGAFRYNNRIYTDTFSYQCPKCSQRYTTSTEETNRHQDGLEIEKHIKEIKRLLKRHTNDIGETKLIISSKLVSIFSEEFTKP